MKVTILSIVGIFIILSMLLTLASTEGNNSYCPRKYQGIKDHTACIMKSEDYVSGGVTNEDRKIIIDLHNKIRAAVTPPACSMMKLYWDDELAFLAQKWADNCKYIHDKTLQRIIPGSYTTGQNLGMNGANWTSVINKWYEEKKAFSFGGSNFFSKIGHYRQMISGPTTLIGCGFGNCTSKSIYVCNYGPGGNITETINYPYQKCLTASPLKVRQIDEEAAYQLKGEVIPTRSIAFPAKDEQKSYWDCKGKFCKNEGRFERNSCNCLCEASPQISGPTCAIDCAINDRPALCGFTYNSKSCKFANVPSRCPWLCNVCPYINGSGSFKYSAKYLLLLTVLFLIQVM